jgi:hypothetical protein
MKYRLYYYVKFRDDSMTGEHDFESASHEEARQTAEDFVAAKDRENSENYRDGKINRDDLAGFRLLSVNVVTQEMKEVVTPI